MSGRIDIAVADGLAIVELMNSERRNAISTVMWNEIAAFCRRAEQDDAIRVVMIRGNGDRFSAGADISDFEDARSDHTNAQGYDDLVELTCRAIEALPQPTMAAIRGHCLGAGASLAASCDLRIASHDASFGVPAARLGLGYDIRGIERFRAVFGANATMELLFTASRMSAERAYALGAVNVLTSPDRFDDEARRLADVMIANAPLTIRAAKAALRAIRSGDPSLRAIADDLAKAADRSDDYREGRAAFAAKRAPAFKAR